MAGTSGTRDRRLEQALFIAVEKHLDPGAGRLAAAHGKKDARQGAVPG